MLWNLNYDSKKTKKLYEFYSWLPTENLIDVFKTIMAKGSRWLGLPTGRDLLARLYVS